MFEVRISVTSEGDATQESEVVKAIAAHFLKMGVKRVVVIANDQQINYVDGEVYNATTGDLFRSDPQSEVHLYAVSHTPHSIN